MSTEGARGDVSCDLRDIETASISEGWHEVLARTYGVGFDVRPAPRDGKRFAASASRWSLGTLALVRTTHDAGTGRRGPAEIAVTEDDVVGLLYLRTGTLALQFDGREATLRPGQLVLWDGQQRGGFAAFGPVDNQTVVIPRSRLRSVAPAFERLVGHPFAASDPTVRLIGHFLSSLPSAVGDLDAAGRVAVGDATVDLARAVLAPRVMAADRPAPALLTAVRLYIDRHLADPALSPAAIAAANAISLRTLHRLFEPTDTSVQTAIRQARLERCHAELLRGGDESVTTIAMRWGFRNMSSFSRAFRDRYGDCARDVQAAARSATTPGAS
jgi:AraC-like DNA-binding protein